MSATDKKLKQLLNDYDDRFKDPFPMWGYTAAEAIALIESALASGEPVQEGAEKNIPTEADL